jgi:hypothetical protein
VTTLDPEVVPLVIVKPVAVHAVALVDAQVSVTLPPVETDVGFAVKVTVGLGAGVTLIVVDCEIGPLLLVQVTV